MTHSPTNSPLDTTAGLGQTLSSQDDSPRKIQCEVCHISGDLLPCDDCQTMIHEECAGIPAAPDARTPPRVWCTHCVRRGGIRDIELSSDKSSNSRDTAPSGSSSTDDIDGSDNVETWLPPYAVKRTRAGKRVNIHNKGQNN